MSSFGCGGRGGSSGTSVNRKEEYDLGSTADTGVVGYSSTAAAGSCSSPSTSGVVVPMLLACCVFDGFSDISAERESVYSAEVRIGSRVG